VLESFVCLMMERNRGKEEKRREEKRREERENECCSFLRLLLSFFS